MVLLLGQDAMLKKVREEFNSELVRVRHTAHCLPLAASDADKSVEQVEKYQQDFVSNSAGMRNKLHGLQKQLDEPPFKM